MQNIMYVNIGRDMFVDYWVFKFCNNCNISSCRLMIMEKFEVRVLF